MSSKTRLDRAYKNAKRIIFNNASNLFFLAIAIEATIVLQMILLIIVIYIFMH